MIEIRKVVRDGRVAVLYSPGYGAGWYSWRSGNDAQMVFSPELVAAVERGASYKEKTDLAKALFPNDYCGGAGNLEIEWVPKGTSFEIQEYDGSESVRYADRTWLVA